MNKITTITLVAFIFLLTACGNQEKERLLAGFDQDLANRSNYLYVVNDGENSGLINENGDVILNFQEYHISSFGKEKSNFAFGNWALLASRNWEPLYLGENTKAKDFFYFKGQDYILIERASFQVYILDSKGKAKAFLPDFNYNIECSENYCHYEISDSRTVFLNENFEQILKIGKSLRLTSHPKYDHIICQENYSDDLYEVYVHNLKNGKTIASEKFSLQSKFYRYYDLLQQAVRLGQNFLPLIKNSRAELDNYNKMIEEGSLETASIYNDSIKIQLYNLDLEPIEGQLYKGKYFSENLSAYAQLGYDRIESTYNLLFFEEGFPKVEGLEYAFVNKNWTYLKRSSKDGTLYYKGQALMPLKKQNVEIINQQYFSLEELTNRSFRRLYDSTGQEIWSGSDCRFLEVYHNRGSKIVTDYIGLLRKDSILLLQPSTGKYFGIDNLEAAEKKNGYKRILFLGDDLWAVEGYAVMKANKILYKLEYSYNEWEGVSFSRISNRLIKVGLTADYYSKADTSFESKEVFRLIDTTGREIIAADFFLDYSLKDFYQEKELINLKIYQEEEDYPQEQFFDQTGRLIYPKYAEDLRRIAHLQTREDLMKTIEDQGFRVDTLSNVRNLEEALSPLRLDQNNQWSFYITHFKDAGNRKSLVYNHYGENLLDGLDWDDFATAEEGDYLLLHNISIGDISNAKDLPPIILYIKA